MLGMTGSRLVAKGTAGMHAAPQNLLGVMVPHKTVVSSQQLVDHLGRPTYRKDIKV